jgi:hypothetical protein
MWGLIEAMLSMPLEEHEACLGEAARIPHFQWRGLLAFDALVPSWRFGLLD